MITVDQDKVNIVFDGIVEGVNVGYYYEAGNGGRKAAIQGTVNAVRNANASDDQIRRGVLKAVRAGEITEAESKLFLD